MYVIDEDDDKNLDAIDMTFMDKENNEQRIRLSLKDIISMLRTNNASQDIMITFMDQRDFDKLSIIQILLALVILFLPDTAEWFKEMITVLNKGAAASGKAQTCTTDLNPHPVVYSLLALHIIQMAICIFENNGMFVWRFNTQWSDFVKFFKFFAPFAFITDFIAAAVSIYYIKQGTTFNCPSIYFVYLVFDLTLSFLKIPNMFFEYHTNKGKTANIINECLERIYFECYENDGLTKYGKTDK